MGRVVAQGEGELGGVLVALIEVLGEGLGQDRGERVVLGPRRDEFQFGSSWVILKKIAMRFSAWKGRFPVSIS